MYLRRFYLCKRGLRYFLKRCIHNQSKKANMAPKNAKAKQRALQLKMRLLLGQTAFICIVIEQKT